MATARSKDNLSYLDNDSHDSSADTVQFISNYLKISEIQIITNSRERTKKIKEWLALYHTPDAEEAARYHARDCIILNTFFLFPHVLAKKRFTSSLFEEAMQNLVLCTIKAIEKYDTSRDTKFSSYLHGYIKDAIDLSIKGESLIRTPSYYKKPTRVVGFIEDEVNSRDDESAELVLDDTQEGLEDELPVKWHHVKTSMMYTDTLSSDSISRDALNGYLPTDTQLEHDTYLKQLYSLLEQVLGPQSKLLSRKEKQVIIYRFGIFGAPKLTLEQVADMFKSQNRKASRVWIHLIEKKACVKIHDFLKANGIKGSIFQDF